MPHRADILRKVGLPVTKGRRDPGEQSLPVAAEQARLPPSHRRFEPPIENPLGVSPPRLDGPAVRPSLRILPSASTRLAEEKHPLLCLVAPALVLFVVGLRANTFASFRS